MHIWHTINRKKKYKINYLHSISIYNINISHISNELYQPNDNKLNGCQGPPASIREYKNSSKYFGKQIFSLENGGNTFISYVLCPRNIFNTNRGFPVILRQILSWIWSGPAMIPGSQIYNKLKWRVETGNHQINFSITSFFKISTSQIWHNVSNRF